MGALTARPNALDRLKDGKETIPVLYESTRGEAPVLGFEDVLLKGLAGDGGLYWPQSFPTLDLARLKGADYRTVAQAVMAPFVGEGADLPGLVDRAYAGFAHREVAPLRQLGANEWLMELYHGPTLAFKDVAMQLLGHLFDDVLDRRGGRVTVIGATSGDTGSAAIEAFAGKAHADIVILHPKGRTSEVQRRQMTTVMDSNVHNIAVEGTFDDCQAMVKAMFADRKFADRVSMSGVNSINWARVMAQTVYYVTASLALGGPERAVSFSVPTGNFGDILAGLVAKKMGVPIERLVIATNINDILTRTLSTGRYEVTSVTATTSPSMDIQVSSNFERLLFEAHGRDADAVRRLMNGLKQTGAFTLEEGALNAIRGDFDAGRADEAEVGAMIKQVARDAALLIDPHTAVGVAVARKQARSDAPMVVLGTAHPAKFPDAVEAATGQRPGLPPRLADLFEREERYTVLPNELGAVQDHILKAVGA